DLATWALGFTGGEAAVHALIRVLEEGQNGTQRALAALGLGRLGGPRGSRALLQASEALLAGGVDEHVRVALVWALGRAGVEAAVEPLGRVLRAGRDSLAGVAARALARIGGDAAFEALLR